MYAPTAVSTKVNHCKQINEIKVSLALKYV